MSKLSKNKYKTYYRVNNKLNKVYTKNLLKLNWIVPVTSKPTVFEFQFYNPSKIPISLVLKYNKCIKCTSNTSNNNINNIKKVLSTSSNKCVHSKSIKTFPTTVNLKVIKNINTYNISFSLLLK